MLAIKTFTKEFSVSPQILVDDLPTIIKLGYKSIINNRPDREESDQPSHDSFRQKCIELGLDYHYLPVIPGQLTQQNSQDMNDLMNKMEKPILAFCRTGTRACLLWLGATLDSKTLEERVEIASQNGYVIDINQIPSLIKG